MQDLQNFGKLFDWTTEYLYDLPSDQFYEISGKYGTFTAYLELP